MTSTGGGGLGTVVVELATAASIVAEVELLLLLLIFADDNVDVVPLGVTDDGWMDAVDVKDVDVVVDFSSGAAGS